MRRLAQEATLLGTVVLLAVIVWFVIADAENREIESRLGFSLTVETAELGSNLVVAGEPLPVTLTVVGRQADVESARPEHFRASVSLRNRAAGRHSLPVRVEALSGDVRVRAVQPETAVVILQETVEREVPVVVEPSNLPPLGFRVGVPQVVPATATVSGIAAEVEAVETVVARIDLGGVNATVEREVTLEARTAAGGAVSQVVVNPRTAAVRVPVEQELFRRTASILPSVVGVPADGYRVRIIRATPSTVDVLVSVDELDTEVEVMTEPVDVTGRGSDLFTQARLVFVEGAAAAGDPDVTVRVVVVIEPIITSVTLPIAVETFAARSEMEVVLVTPRSVRVTLRGPVALISELEGPLPAIRVNLGGYAVGRHRIDLRLVPPTGLELVELDPAQVTVVLSAIAAPAPVDAQEEPVDESGEDEAIEEDDSE